jgi:alginate O-acetyltransferase complex protein AlgI
VLWGLYKKVVVADNLALIANPIFSSPGPYYGSQVLLAVYAFTLQIYCDFSGYSDMARGLGKMMGFDIMLNFNLPYFATNPIDFWRRWHISLTSWLRDYLYIPLGGNKRGALLTYRNLMITMILGGLWHGAAWHYVAWGLYHSSLLCAYKFILPYLEVLPKIRKKFLQNVWFLIRIIFFFQLTCIGMLIFRAGSLAQVRQMLSAIFIQPQSLVTAGLREGWTNLILFTFFLALVECFQRAKGDLMLIVKLPTPLRWTVYYGLILSILVFRGQGTPFIYFQF